MFVFLSTVKPEVQEGVTVEEGGGLLSDFTGSCSKNEADPSHHKAFLSPDEFKDNSFDLPKEFDFVRKAFFNYVMSSVLLVTRIHGRFISSYRPDDYLFSDKTGQKFDSGGSGCINRVVKVKDDGKIVDENKRWYEGHIDKCDKCRSCLTTQDNIWYIEMFTVKHVVFDESESRQCQVVFFDYKRDLVFDYDVVKKSDWCCGYTDIEKDYCQMFVLTENESLATKLKTELDRRDEKLLEVIELITQNSNYKQIEKGPVVILGYPHGRKLYLSCGRHCGKADESFCSLTYDTKTCKGCSGGLVVDLFWKERYCHKHPHSGSNDGTGESSDLSKELIRTTCTI